MMRALSLVLLLLTAACAWTPDSVVIRRQAVPVAMVPQAAGVLVTVVAADARQEREISHKKNGYGMRAADISAENDIIAEIRAGVAEILGGQGFGSGADATVRIEVTRFYNMFDLGFWSATANAQVTASLQVQGADGRSLYGRVYSANHPLTGQVLMNATAAQTALQGALAGLLQQIANDPQLTSALLQARPAPPPEPVAPEPVRRPARRPIS